MKALNESCFTKLVKLKFSRDISSFISTHFSLFDILKRITFVSFMTMKEIRSAKIEIFVIYDDYRN